MEFIDIGDSGIRASRIALGTWSIGGFMWGGTEEKQALDTIRTALDRGITTLDTAPVYGKGDAERLVGRVVSEVRRDDVVLATKAGLEWDEEGNIVRNSTPERIRVEIEDSLRRLETDFVDLYQVHWPDPLVPFEDTAAELEKLRDEGKVRAIGVSNYSPAQMDRFRKVAPLASSQPPYNLFERGIEDGVLPYCLEHEVTVLAYGALCRGLLSGKMSKDRQFEGDDVRRQDPKFQGERFEQYLEAVEKLDRLARERWDRRVIHLAVRWLLDRGVGIALWGARKPEQLDPIDGMTGWTVDAAAQQEIDRILIDTVEDPVGPEFMAPPTREEESLVEA